MTGDISSNADLAPRDWNDDLTREQAIKIAERLAEIAFKNRSGHGGKRCNPTVGYRQMRPDELVALLVTAFEAGAKWESRR